VENLGEKGRYESETAKIRKYGKVMERSYISNLIFTAELLCVLVSFKFVAVGCYEQVFTKKRA